ncbi:unnamed protein product [Polarella glacialis]|uniref:Uncharacterized protein n=1 Tax=Polarella glacialis TaxID=89957 RepID=A0A813FJ25_POLGL|nr:unnamed protein product [Polarella glacialis]
MAFALPFKRAGVPHIHVSLDHGDNNYNSNDHNSSDKCLLMVGSPKPPEHHGTRHSLWPASPSKRSDWDNNKTNSPSAGNDCVQRLRGSSAPPLLRRRSSLANCSDATVIRAMYHHAREHLATVRQSDAKEDQKRGQGWRILAAVRYASRAVIMSNSVIQGWLQDVAERLQLDKQRAEAAWVALRLSSMGESDDETKKQEPPLLGKALGEMLEGIEGTDGLRQAAAKVIVDLTEAEKALRRLHAAYAVQLESLEQMHDVLGDCAAEAMRRIALFEGSLSSARACLRAARASQEFPNNNSSSSANLTDGQLDTNNHNSNNNKNNNSSSNNNQGRTGRVMLAASELEKALCDEPVRLLQYLVRDITSAHLASGMPELPCLAQLTESCDFAAGDAEGSAEPGLFSPAEAGTQEVGEGAGGQARSHRRLSCSMMQIFRPSLEPLPPQRPVLRRLKTEFSEVVPEVAALRARAHHRTSLPSKATASVDFEAQQVEGVFGTMALKDIGSRHCTTADQAEHAYTSDEDGDGSDDGEEHTQTPTELLTQSSSITEGASSQMAAARDDGIVSATDFAMPRLGTDNNNNQELALVVGCRDGEGLAGPPRITHRDNNNNNNSEHIHPSDTSLADYIAGSPDVQATKSVTSQGHVLRPLPSVKINNNNHSSNNNNDKSKSGPGAREGLLAVQAPLSKPQEVAATNINNNINNNNKPQDVAATSARSPPPPPPPQQKQQPPKARAALGRGTSFSYYPQVSHSPTRLRQPERVRRSMSLPTLLPSLCGKALSTGAVAKPSTPASTQSAARLPRTHFPPKMGSNASASSCMFLLGSSWASTPAGGRRGPQFHDNNNKTAPRLPEPALRITSSLPTLLMGRAQVTACADPKNNNNNKALTPQVAKDSRQPGAAWQKAHSQEQGHIFGSGFRELT